MLQHIAHRLESEVGVEQDIVIGPVAPLGGREEAVVVRAVLVERFQLLLVQARVVLINVDDAVDALLSAAVQKDLQKVLTVPEDVVSAAADDDQRTPVREFVHNARLRQEDLLFEGVRVGEGGHLIEETRGLALHEFHDAVAGEAAVFGHEVDDVVLVIVSDAEAFCEVFADEASAAAALTADRNVIAHGFPPV